MRTASIDAHVKRIWNPEEDISLLGFFRLFQTRNY
jgi:hypothetical protein